MRRARHLSFLWAWRRPAGAAFVATAILIGATGVSCDDDAASVFRQETTAAIGDGVKTIVDALIDGAVETIIQAGDGPSDSNSDSSSSSTSTSSG